MALKSKHEIRGLTQIDRQWSTQRAPYKEPLPFYSSTTVETQYPGQTGIVNDSFRGIATMRDSSDMIARSIALNGARSKLATRLNEGASAQLGLTIIKWRSSLQMIDGALRSLVSKKERAKRYYTKSTGEIYLEGIFGWLPMINDIWSAYKVLQTSQPTHRLTGKGEAEFSAMENSSIYQRTTSTRVGARAVAQFRVENLNVVLLNQLGLLNPASVAWDAVPYSFVLNWFVPVGVMLNSLTDFVGYRVEYASFTTMSRKNVSGSFLDTGKYPYTWRGREVRNVEVQRNLGLPPYKLPPASLPRGDLSKALIAYALFQGKAERHPPVRKDLPPPRLRYKWNDRKG